MKDEELIAAFDEEMLLIYQRALSEAGYKATRSLQKCCMNIGDCKRLAFCSIQQQFRRVTALFVSEGVWISPSKRLFMTTPGGTPYFRKKSFPFA